MNITRENVDNLNTLLTVTVEKSDYEEQVDKVLRDYRRNANIKGFRQGNAPMGMIRRMYYVPVLADEVNKLVSQSLYDYLGKEEIRILGEPLAKVDEEKSIDFEKDEQFEFQFELGLSPEIKLEITEKEKFPLYKIKVAKKELDEYKENVAKHHGEFVSVDEAGNDELIKCNLVKVNKDGEPVEDGISVEDVSMSLEMMKDKEQQKLFKGAKKGDEIIFDVKKAYPNDTEVASLLRIDKDEVPLIDGTFKCTINDVQKFEKAEINEELFNKIYGEGEVKTEAEFDSRLKEEMKTQYDRDSDYRFGIDVKEMLTKKAKIDLPVEFLKRWLLETNENMTREQVESEFSQYEDDFKWQLIKDHLYKVHDIKVDEQEIRDSAREVARAQYQQYGIHDIPDEYVDNFANELLSKNEEARRITDRKLEEKLLNFIKNTAKIEEKEISLEKFRNLFDKK
ncbi:MAG: trigger factor [Bacteroidales bacterium]|nr:trigger factor [Bacteroidales bacterium]MDT8430292.1 trigger factor [Bacteroidales bacterium]